MVNQGCFLKRLHTVDRSLLYSEQAGNCDVYLVSCRRKRHAAPEAIVKPLSAGMQRGGLASSTCGHLDEGYLVFICRTVFRWWWWKAIAPRYEMRCTVVRYFPVVSKACSIVAGTLHQQIQIAEMLEAVIALRTSSRIEANHAWMRSR